MSPVLSVLGCFWLLVLHQRRVDNSAFHVRGNNGSPFTLMAEGTTAFATFGAPELSLAPGWKCAPPISELGERPFLRLRLRLADLPEM